MQPTSLRRLSAFAAFATATLILSPHLRAAGFVWSGATDSNWSTTTNWSPVGTPGSADTSDFDSTNNGHTTISLGTGVTINQLFFDSHAAAYTIGSGAVGSQTLTLTDGGTIKLLNTVALSNQLINSALVLGTTGAAATYRLDNLQSGTTLTVAGNISGGSGGTAGAKALEMNSTGDTTLSGIIANGGATSLALNKSGTGTLTLIGANTYTGGTVINDGGVKLSGSGRLGATTGSLFVGGTLDFGGTSQTVGALSGGGGTIFNNGGGASMLTVNTTAVNQTFSGVIADNTNASAGTMAFTKSGSGSLTFTGANSYSGETLVSGGVLSVSGSGKLGNTTGTTTVSSGATLYLQTDVGAEAIRISGTGATGQALLATGALQGFNTTYSGLLTLGASATIATEGSSSSFDLTNPGTITGAGFTLTLAGSSTTAGSIASIIGTTTGGITVSGGKWTLSGTNTFTGAMTVSGNSTLVVPTVNNASANGPLGNSANAVTLGGTLEYTGVTATSSKKFALGSTYGGTFQIDNAATDLTLSGIISGTAVPLTKTGSGTLTLSGVNTYTNDTIVNAGTLKLSGSGKLGATTNALEFGGGTLDLNGTLQTASTVSGTGTILNNGSGTSTLTENFTGYVFSGGVLSISVPQPFAGVIVDHNNGGSGVVALVKAGNGDLSLTGANTYSGTTTISGGTIFLSGNGTLGSTAGATSVASGATLFLSDVTVGGEAVSIAGAGVTLTGYGAITNGALETSGTVTYGGLLSLPTAAATIYVDDGTLAITNPGTITGAAHALTLAGVGSGSIASVIGTTTGGVTIAGVGPWTLTGANTFTGALNVNGGGRLVVPTVNNASTAGPLGNSATAVTLGSNNQGAYFEYTGGSASSTKPFALVGGIFTIDSAATELTLSGLISGTNGTLYKSGPGTLTLSNASNSYSFGTTIYSGTLKLSGTGRLGATTGRLDMEAGTLDLNGTSQTVGQLYGTSGVVLNNGGGTSTLTVNTTDTGVIYYGTIVDNNNSTAGKVAITKSGTGILSLFTGTSYSGATTVSAGMLSLGDSDAIGSTSGVTVTSGATVYLAGSNLNIGTAPITISGAGGSNGAIGALESGNDGNTYGGLLKLGAAATIASDSGTFHVTNTGTITGAFLLTLGGSGDGVLDSIVGTSAVTKSGTGTWALTGANTYAGATTISAGILNIQNASALGTTAGGTTMPLGSTGTLQIQGGITVGAEALTIRGVGASGATGALENVADTNNFGGLVTLAAASTISSDTGTLNLTNPGTIAGATFGLTLAGAGNGSIASNIGTTTGTLTKNGTGTWTLSGANTYTGLTTINAGTLDIKNSTALGTVAGGVSIVTGATLAMEGNIAVGAEALTLRGAGASGATGALENVSGTNSYGGLVTLGADSTISSDVGTLSLTNAGTITGATFGLTLTGASSGSIASIIGTTSGGVTKTGAGAWSLSGANTFSGALAVKNGTLSFPTFNNASANGPLGNSANAIVLGDIGTFGLLEYTGGTASSSKPLSLAGNGGKLQIDIAATELTLTGGLSGSGFGFYKLGPGTLTLATANAFAGGVEIDAGTLKLSAPGALGQALRLYVYGTLQLAGTGDRIGDTTDVGMFDGGKLSLAGLSNQSETMGVLDVHSFFGSTIDFGSGSGDSLFFSGVINNLNKLAISNWSGTPGVLGTASSDRLIFSGVSSTFTSLFTQSDISFNGVNGYDVIQYDASHYEVVAVPEPSAVALLGFGVVLGGGALRPGRKRS